MLVQFSSKADLSAKDLSAGSLDVDFRKCTKDDEVSQTRLEGC